MNKADHELKLRAVVAVCVAAVLIVIAVGVAVYNVTESNNRRAIEEKKLAEEARKAKASDDLEAGKVRAAKEREAEIKSKKRKIWERDAEGASEPAPGEPGWQPGEEKF
jgi:uncharacterized protein HemX